MISSQKEALMENWGDKANAMECFAEVKYIDPNSCWSCYIYAMNPNDDNEIMCIIDGHKFELCNWSLNDLKHTYNQEGEYLIIDPEYRKIRADVLYKKLKRNI